MAKILVHKNGFKREDKEAKIDYTLIPTEVLKRIAIHFTNGAKVHGVDNWKLSEDLDTFKASAFRHLMAVLEGDIDEDHESALIWNIMCIMWHRDQNEVHLGEFAINDIDDTYEPRKEI